MKKIPLILIAIIGTLLFAFFGWFLFFRNPNIPAGESIRNLLPFGSGENINIPLLPGDDEPVEMPMDEVPFDEFGTPTTNLFRISEAPVAGFVTFKRGNESIVRFVDRSTGHIYDYMLPRGTTTTLFVEKIKVTNNTLPKIYEAHFRPDGNAVLLRSLEDDTDVVKNNTLTLTPPQASSTTLYNVSSTALRGDISTVSVGSGNTLFYALRDTSSIVSSTFSGTSARTLLSSPYTEWRLHALNSRLVVYTKAGAGVPGYAYTTSLTGGALVKILGPLNGLTVTPNSLGNRVLYSYVEDNKTRSFAKNLVNNTVDEILPATLAEKCVWSTLNVGVLFCGTPIDTPGNREPDNWYRGRTHFSDRIWRFDTNADIAQVLAEPKESRDIDLDIIDPKLSPDETYLIFTNKTDLSLWVLRLN